MNREPKPYKLQVDFLQYAQVQTPVQSLNPDEGRRIVRVTTAIAKVVNGAIPLSPDPIYIMCQNAEGISEYSGTSSCVIAVLFYDANLFRWESYESTPFVINSSVNTLNITATQLQQNIEANLSLNLSKVNTGFQPIYVPITLTTDSVGNPILATRVTLIMEILPVSNN